MPVIRAILISLLIHFLFTSTVIWIAPHFEKTKPPEVIEVSLPTAEKKILDALTPVKKQIIRKALVPDKLKAPDDENLARFLSEQKQRVRQESQAAKSGMTANRNNIEAQKATNTANTEKPRQRGLQAKNVEMDKDGYHTVDISKELQEVKNFNEGLSTIGESMPHDVKVGSFTALNTDRYLFYTFYARMEEAIRFRWESRVQQAIRRFDGQTMMQAGDHDWITHVEFLLDKDGFLKQALIMKESGIPLFDGAAVNAFKDAKVFPNPPPEMVQEDGYIHIKFSFTVNFRPPNLVNRN
ncbi:MAG: energy transducer TonB family protein [Pseudobdellovibrionaceae bacterium]